MIQIIKRFPYLFAVLALALSIGACGSGGEDNEGIPGQVSVAVSAPNGDPISGATVWVPNGAATMKSLQVDSSTKALTDDEGETCADVPEPAFDSDCSGADGSATLACEGEGEITIKFAKGSFSGVLSATCGQAAVVQAAFGTGSTSMAVVTGAFDRMEDVLAKLGFGMVDDFGLLEMGSETFTLYDGNNTLDDGTYKNFEDVLLDPTELAKNDIIFINCDQFGLGSELDTDTATKLANLRQYVEDGGKIYVTDLSYDYVEQAFPDYVDFQGDDAVPGDAENGFDREDPNAKVNNSDLAAWLDNITVNTGNPDDNCFDTTINGKNGARNEDGSIFIADLLGGWAIMDGEEAAPAGPMTQWIQGTDLEGAALRPLTATFEVGSNGGRVLYTSYHTADTCPTQGFWPQERVLQYLVFEL